jgi:hypothetical protein
MISEPHQRTYVTSLACTLARALPLALLALALSLCARAIRAEELTVENAAVRVRYANDGRVQIEPVRAISGAAKVELKLLPELTASGAPTASRVERDNVGSGSAIEVRAKDGSVTQRIWAPADQPFVCTNISLKNTGGEANTIKTLVPLSAAIEPQSNASDLRVFGSDGPALASKGKTSYVFLALVDPKTRAGLVSGWLTHERASGVVGLQGDGGPLHLDARSEYGRRLIAPGETFEGETFAIGFFDDCRDGLEALANATVKINQIKLLPPWCGYSTWYHGKATGSTGALDEKRMAQLAKFAHDQHLADYGLTFLQIDDQWQIQRRDFTANKPNGPYPGGMKKTADTIHANGFKAGLWLTPFGWQGKDTVDGKEQPNNTALKNHPDWFVHRADGSIYDVRWAGDCLDMSNPQARQFLSEVVGRMTHDWGYNLLKIDGLWAGMACKILYPSPEYRDDGLGDAVFYDKNKSNVEVYRDGLRLVREAAGKDVFLLGCNIAQNMRTMGGSMGLVDAMRVGPDIGAKWDNVVRCARPASILYFWNGKVWHNDPDCLMLRDPLTIENGRAWGSWIALSGQLNLVSEWLPDLAADRLDIYKRTVPNHGHTARPVDLFERDLPRIWHLTWGEGDDRHDVVGLFNWNHPAAAPKNVANATQEEPTEAASKTQKPDGEGESLKLTVDAQQLGIPDAQNAKFVGFDYWGNAFIPAFSGKTDFDVPPGTCKIIALRRASDHPELLSTSRHVSQGLADVIEANWDAAKHTLRGKSKLVGNDPYELRIDAASMKVADASVSADDHGAGVTAAQANQQGRQVRVSITSPATREVTWEVHFAAAE